MNSVDTKINIQQNIFQQLNILEAEFVEIKNTISALQNESTKTFTTIADKIKNINTSAIIEQVKAVAESISELNNPAIDFNAQIADLSAITGIAGDELEELSKASKEVGKSSGLGASQAAKAFKLLASQISVDEIGIDGLKELRCDLLYLTYVR